MKSYTYDYGTQTVVGLEHTMKEEDLLSLGNIEDLLAESLGPAAAYKDKGDTISECLDAASKLSGLLYIVGDFIEEVDEQMIEQVKPAATSRVGTHTGMLKNHNKILAGNNGDRDWHYVGDQRHLLGPARSTIDSTTLDDLLSRSWVDLLVGSEDLETLLATTYFMHHLDKIKCSARRIGDIVPNDFKEIVASIHEGTPVLKMTSTGPRQLDQEETLGLLHFRERESWKDHITQEKIAVHSRHLLGLITDLSENPDRIYAEGLQDSNAQTSEQLAHGLVDDSIVERHNEYFTPLTASKKRKKRLSQYAKRQKEIDGAVSLSIDSADETQATERITLSQESFSSEREVFGEAELTFPWMGSEAKPYAVEVIRNSDRNVFIVNAKEPKAQTISDRARKGLPKNEQGYDSFEQVITQRARALASGVMPYEDNAVKRLSKTDRREGYKGMSIWYSFDISPNAPRTYFTVKPAPKKLGKTVGDDDLLMIVIGQTDKAHQTDLLQRFTTLSRKVLIKGGAGPV